MGFVKYSVAQVDVIKEEEEMPGWVEEASAQVPPTEPTEDLVEDNSEKASEDN